MLLNTNPLNSTLLNGTGLQAIPLVVSVVPNRVRKGDWVTVSFTAPETPWPPPLMEALDANEVPAVALLVPLRSKPRDFAVPFTFPADAGLGTYFVYVSFTGASGVRYAGLSPVELVAGGDYGGSVISLFASEHPEATRVVAQLSSGRLVQGDNPHL